MDQRLSLVGLTHEFRCKCTESKSLLDAFASFLGKLNVRRSRGHWFRISHIDPKGPVTPGSTYGN